jgi:hypothetical protein
MEDMPREKTIYMLENKDIEDLEEGWQRRENARWPAGSKSRRSQWYKNVPATNLLFRDSCRGTPPPLNVSI